MSPRGSINGRLVRRIVIAALPLAAAGCAVPVGVAIGGWAADGVSLAWSGKTVSDHAISGAMGEDCRMWRLFVLSAPCRNETAIALAEAVPEIRIAVPPP